MTYGERKGMSKMPGEYSLADLLGFGLAGSLGIVAAVMIDMQQSDEGSALFYISRWFSWFTELIGIGVLPLYAVILALMALGAAAVYYFQPVTMQGAFAQGFGVLAALMTIVPSDLGTPLEAPDMPIIVEEEPETTAQIEAQLTGLVGNAEGMAVRGSLLQQAVYTDVSPARYAGTQTVAYQTRQSEVKYNLTIEIVFPNGLESDPDSMIRKGNLRGKIHDDTTGSTYNVFRNSGAIIRQSSDGKMLTVMTSIPGNSNSSRLQSRIEASGYAITVEDFTATTGNNNVWRITLTPSKTPLFMQRLGQSYPW